MNVGEQSQWPCTARAEEAGVVQEDRAKLDRKGAWQDYCCQGQVLSGGRQGDSTGTHVQLGREAVVGAHEGLGTTEGGGLRVGAKPVRQLSAPLGQEGKDPEVRGVRPVPGAD